MILNLINSTFRVCVDGVADGHISGRVYGQRLVSPLLFRDMGDFILQAEDVMDEQDFPRAYQRKRSFTPEQEGPTHLDVELEGNFMSSAQVEAEKGSLCTFVVSVATRQNTSWQGKIDWLNGEQPQVFNSALELIRVVDKRLVKDEAEEG